MNIVCPNNPKHEVFRFTAHVTQDWLVNKKGDFEEVIQDCVEVTHGPSPDGYYECHECGEEAVVKND